MRTTTNSIRHLFSAVLVLAMVAASGCGGGGESGESGGGDNGSGGNADGANGTGSSSTGSEAPEGTPGGSSSGSTGGVPDDQPSPGASQPDDDVSVPDQTSGVPTPPTTDFPFSGTFVVDEYSPSINSPDYEGIVEIEPSPLRKTRILNGSHPRRYPDGRTTYRQPCGQRVARIALADSDNLSTPITPCSSEVPNAGASPTNFFQSNLSPDGSLVAVEAAAFLSPAGGGSSVLSFSTLVFDITSQEVLAVWQGGYEATWTPDGRLLLASDEGLQLLDANLDNPVRIGDEIAGPVSNPDVSPDGTAIVFEFNQQIWGMNIDGSSARELVTSASRLRFPVWAPDGSLTIAYLAVPSDDKYFGVIFVLDLEAGQEYPLVLDPVLEFGSSYFLRTINGPLNWNQ